MASAESASKVEADNRKIFIGGISWEATSDELRAYMEQWGAVKDVTIKTDAAGNPRGFGFVLFESESSVDAVLAAGPLQLKDKKIEAKRAAVKEIKQIFVGGVNPQMPEDEIRTHFEQFGTIESMDLPKDPHKGTRRGFVFITFTTVEACNAATASKDKQQLGDNLVDVKKAMPQNKEFHPAPYDYAAHGYAGYGAYPPAPYGAPYGWGGGGGGGRGAPRGRGGFVGYPVYNPYDQTSWYGYPPAPPAGGGKIRGRGRGGPAQF